MLEHWIHDHLSDTLVGALVAMATAVFIEWLRRPKFALTVEAPHDTQYPPGRPAVAARYLRVLCENKNLWIAREAALECYGYVSFHGPHGGNVFGERNAMELRWSKSQDPLPVEVHIGSQVGRIFDPVRMTLESRIDIHPGISQPLDIAVKFDGEPECYGWNNENYYSNPPWRNQKWRLGPGRYFVRVIVVSGSVRSLEWFHLRNYGAAGGFRLDPAPTDSTPYDDDE